MSEPDRFSLEWLVAEFPTRGATVLAALIAAVAAIAFGREFLLKIPELVETGYSYDLQLRATVANRSLATEGLSVTFVDVDDAAIRLWGGATRTMPRERLADLLDRVGKKGPKLVLLDFALSGHGPAPGDKILGDYLSSYPQSSPPLFLAAEAMPSDCKGETCDTKECKTPDGSIPVRLNPTPFDELIGQHPNVRWVSSVFLPEEDGVVRSWHLWDYVCQGGTATAIPSAQLAAAAFASDAGDGRERLRRYLDFLAKSDKDASLEWPRNRDAKDALIPYLIGGSAKSQISDFLGSSGFRYERVRAQSLADDQVADAALKDRIVVIGASYGPDKFATPFGTMPGAALIANAIAVAPAVLSSPPRHHLVVFLALLLALIYALIAKKFRAIIAAVIIAAFSWIWLSLATYSARSFRRGQCGQHGFDHARRILGARSRPSKSCLIL